MSMSSGIQTVNRRLNEFRAANSTDADTIRWTRIARACVFDVYAFGTFAEGREADNSTKKIPFEILRVRAAHRR